MAIPVIKLNLVPPPTLWRRRHELIGWASLCLGSIFLVLVIGFVWLTYREADKEAKKAVKTITETSKLGRMKEDLFNQLRAIDVSQEMPRWKLVERILSERSLPWSRLSAELERCLALDVRLKSVQRSRDTTGVVILKLKGEAKSREAEAAFLENLQKNAVFQRVILEREGERQGGGWEFDCTLTGALEPPPYEPLPQYARPLSKEASAQPELPKQPFIPPSPTPKPMPSPMKSKPIVPSQEGMPPHVRMRPIIRKPSMERRVPVRRDAVEEGPR